MKQLVTILLIIVSLSACNKNYEAPVPDLTWDLFNTPGATALTRSTLAAMDGVYTVSAGTDQFGGLAAVKWNYGVIGTDTTFHLSGFFGKDVSYFICEGKRLGDSILLNGYWRKMVSIETGVIRFTISANSGALGLLGATPSPTIDTVTITGVYGNNLLSPDQAISIRYQRPLHSRNGFNILAHRSGGRTSDLLPFSENSVEMIRKTAEFGSTGIEIDVRFTKDGVPILYHDNTLNLREIQKTGLVGPIENYTFDQLSTFVRLIHGEKIPTLRQALDAVLYNTPLTFVWLDTKYIGSLEPVRQIQREYLQLAAARGRQLNIVIGLPTDDAFDHFKALPNYLDAPSLCELSPEKARDIQADVWAPRFTLGTQNDAVATAHAEGRQVFVWTLDVPEYIEDFINDGDFDGILSNYPSAVAYYFYVQE